MTVRFIKKTICFLLILFVLVFTSGCNNEIDTGSSASVVYEEVIEYVDNASGDSGKSENAEDIDASDTQDAIGSDTGENSNTDSSSANNTSQSENTSSDNAIQNENSNQDFVSSVNTSSQTTQSNDVSLDSTNKKQDSDLDSSDNSNSQTTSSDDDNNTSDFEEQPTKNVIIENSSTIKKYADTIMINGKKYNYVWGDEFSENTIDYSEALYDGSAPITDGKIWDTTGMLPWFSDISIPANPADREYYNHIKNGELVMKAGCFDWSKYEKGSTTFNYKSVSDDLKYASGGILTTRKTMVYRRGYAEIYAKLPLANGGWPAWWLRSTGSELIKYPDGSTEKDPIFTLEIDIFESWDYLGDKIYPNIHKWYKNTYDPTTDSVVDYNGYDITNKIIAKKNYEPTQFSCCPSRETFEIVDPDEYHTYGFWWTDTIMVFMVDGIDYFTFDLTEPFDGYSDGKYDYNQYMYFLLDCYMITPGAEWGGTAEQRYTGTGDTSDIEMNVKYIRLWQEDGKEDIILR